MEWLLQKAIENPGEQQIAETINSHAEVIRYLCYGFTAVSFLCLTLAVVIVLLNFNFAKRLKNFASRLKKLEN